MTQDEHPARPTDADRGLGRSFRTVGGLGFWLQILMALAPIAALAAVFASVRGFSLPGGRVGALGWVSLLGLLVLLFTIGWSWRCRGIGRDLESGARPADRGALTRTVWTGVAACAFGVVLSLVAILAEVLHLLLVFLEAPQGGAPVFQTVDGGGPAWITALDLLGLLALTLTASAEIATLLLALWLIHRLALGDARPSAASAG